MSGSSLRARRMARNHKRMSRPARLNLVALMDIFTILVLFLMVNNGDVEVLQPDKNISLPESISEQKPVVALTIKVSEHSISVQGQAIEDVDAALAQEGPVLEALRRELERQSAMAPELAEDAEDQGRRIVVMGDQEMPYLLLKKIMSTCAGTDYRDISLAVSSVPFSEELAMDEPGLKEVGPGEQGG